ncbi:nucleoside diphosphate kinase 6-like [Lytechinus variegatus]|uniref:nucleoside diphosphate kinase 6-like n=1 Tax=Lytechinus variegatus TaxID=7654 RepID=UPI001BB11E85|nr:nucleoside diphosphate kinase 6-like [Lytechinus variegatus]
MCGSVSRLQLTLAIIKPDVVAHPYKFGTIKQIILQNGFLVVCSKRLQWSKSDAARFYAEHEGRFFYNRLVGFMTSGPMCAQVLAGDNAIERWRKLMGPTKTFRAKHLEPNSIRGEHGLTDTRNAAHGSDSPETAAKEINFFFPEFNIAQWYERDEPLFRGGEIDFCTDRGIHIPNPSFMYSER